LSEHEEQVAFYLLANKKRKLIAPFRMLYAVPNAGKRDYRAATYMISEGLRKGVPDMVLAYAASGYHGLYIEFKYGSGTLSKEQRIWKDNLIKCGYAHIVPYTWQFAYKKTIHYIFNKFKMGG
jgi:hypothetical protein